MVFKMGFKRENGEDMKDMAINLFNKNVLGENLARE